MPELQIRLRSDVYRWPPEKILAKQTESLRLVREQMRQERLDGYLPDGTKPSTTDRVLRQLARLRKTWSACQRDRHRDAIYRYLGAVYELVRRWRDQDQVEARVQRIRAVCQSTASLDFDPYAIVIAATSKNVDRKTRSKWSRLLRFVQRYKSDAVSLKRFVKQRGGINACASRYARRLERLRRTH